jgi:hypothetical protein
LRKRLERAAHLELNLLLTRMGFALRNDPALHKAAQRGRLRHAHLGSRPYSTTAWRDEYLAGSRAGIDMQVQRSVGMARITFVDDMLSLPAPPMFQDDFRHPPEMPLPNVRVVPATNRTCATRSRLRVTKSIVTRRTCLVSNMPRTTASSGCVS